MQPYVFEAPPLLYGTLGDDDSTAPVVIHSDFIKMRVCETDWVGCESDWVGFQLDWVGFQLDWVGFQLDWVGFQLDWVGFESDWAGSEYRGAAQSSHCYRGATQSSNCSSTDFIICIP